MIIKNYYISKLKSIFKGNQTIKKFNTSYIWYKYLIFLLNDTKKMI